MKVVTITISDPLIKKLDSYCKNMDRNRSEIIRIALDKYFDDIENRFDEGQLLPWSKDYNWESQ